MTINLENSSDLISDFVSVWLGLVLALVFGLVSVKCKEETHTSVIY